VGKERLLIVATTCCRTEFRWRWWKACGEITSQSEIIEASLRRGLRFRTFLPTREAERLASRDASTSFESGSTMTGGDEFALKADAAKPFGTYEKIMQILLSRPQARTFLLRGGLAWRLALEFGPAGLLNEARQGPSSTAVNQLRGYVCQIGERVIDDEPTDAERELMIGVAQRNGAKASLWPAMELFESSFYWAGEWRAANEAWFVDRLQMLREGTAGFKSGHEWNRWARTKGEKFKADLRLSRTEKDAREDLLRIWSIEKEEDSEPVTFDSIL